MGSRKGTVFFNIGDHGQMMGCEWDGIGMRGANSASQKTSFSALNLWYK